MRKFKVIERGRLSESSMSKIVGGKPCTNNNCGDPTGYSCNAAYGPTNPCPSHDPYGPEVCGRVNNYTCPINLGGGGGGGCRKNELQPYTL